MQSDSPNAKGGAERNKRHSLSSVAASSTSAAAASPVLPPTLSSAAPAGNPRHSRHGSMSSGTTGTSTFVFPIRSVFQSRDSHRGSESDCSRAGARSHYSSGHSTYDQSPEMRPPHSIMSAFGTSAGNSASLASSYVHAFPQAAQSYSPREGSPPLAEPYQRFADYYLTDDGVRPANEVFRPDGQSNGSRGPGASAAKASFTSRGHSKQASPATSATPALSSRAPEPPATSTRVPEGLHLENMVHPPTNAISSSPSVTTSSPRCASSAAVLAEGSIGGSQMASGSTTVHVPTHAEPDDSMTSQLDQEFANIVRVTPIVVTSPGSQRPPDLSPQQMRDATQASVRSFVDQQARTEQLSDPNAASPSPAPEDGDRTASERYLRKSRHLPPGNVTPPPPSATDPTGTTQTLLEDRSDGNSSFGSTTDPDAPVTTFRFQHVETKDGHHVVTGREGKLEHCVDEPITTPGAVQGFGVLILLEEQYETGNLTVRQVSENCTELLGLSPQYLFRLDCFSNILVPEQEDVLRDNMDYVPDPIDTAPDSDYEGPQVFRLSGYGEPGSDDSWVDETGSNSLHRRREWTCWVAASRPRQPMWDKVDEAGVPIPPPDLIILEFELERDNYNPLRQPFDTHDMSSHEMSSEQGDTRRASLTTDSSGSAPRTRSAYSGSSGSKWASRPPSSPDETTHGRAPHVPEPSPLSSSVDDPSPERIIECTTNHARPLRALEGMRRAGPSYQGSETTPSASSGRRRPRRRRHHASRGASDTLDIFAMLKQINDQLGNARDLQTFLDVTVGVIQDVCRFHRVLIYRFDEEMNGEVVTELVDWNHTNDLYKGLKFPAADIPAQARELYKTNKVRFLYDRSQQTARLVLRDRSDLDYPLDMTHCFLRAMSPMHVKYLANMRVRSSMSISIMAFGKLWGLLMCHSYGNHGMRVSFPVRQMLRILSDLISRNIERLSYQHRLHSRMLMHGAGAGIASIAAFDRLDSFQSWTGQAPPSSRGYLVSSANDLLTIFDADSGLLVINDGCKLLGQSDQAHAMLAIAEYLRTNKFDTIKASNYIQQDFPDINLPQTVDTIAGLLYVPLTADAGQDFVVFFRKGEVHEVKWAGNPYNAVEKVDLEPRKSFKLWSETVTGRARKWSDNQLDSASVLALIYGKFIQVWRERQNAMVSNQLTAILLSNTSHAVRTPLSQIINTLELALAGNIDADTRAMLENSHQASRALLFHVHDLLDLTRIETGNETAFNDPFDLRQVIADTMRLYQTETARRGIELKITISDNLPAMVVGDSRKVKTVISNLVANAVKYTHDGLIEIGCHLEPGTESVTGTGSHACVEIVVSDSGCGIPTEKLAKIFVTLEGAEGAMEDRPLRGGVGLGLATVARIVEQLNGQLRAESEVNKGTRFYFTLTMGIYDGVLPPTNGLDALPSYDTDSLIGNRPTLRSNTSSGSSVPANRAPIHRSMLSKGLGGALDGALEYERGVSPFPVSAINSLDPMSTPAAVRSSSALAAPPSARAPKTVPESAVNSSGLTTPTPEREASRKIADKNQKAERARLNGELPHPLRAKRGDKGEQKLRVLVVEDDIINSQILQKRLQMDKHRVHAVENGQEAVDMLTKDWDFDAILMDIQMPIMDGRTAASEIRKLETTLPPLEERTPVIEPIRVDGRIPIFAVSASLYEDDRKNLSANFDGWLLKPLDFTRVRKLLIALEDPEKRNKEVYRPGHWEAGGYFRPVGKTYMSDRSE